jgi:p-aminobenzoyl-glutamate transporter AbgT
MKLFESKNNINENKLKFKKTVSVLGGSVKKDWLFMIFVLVMCLVVTLIFSWNTFRNIQNESFLSDKDVEVKGSLKVNTEQLERVVENLNSKKEQFDALTGVR